jgi:DNA-binding MarR family transcriptional regulator
MKLALASRVLMDCYPRIFFACHRRHVRDQVTQELLSAHQASILDHLDEVEPTSMTALAMHMGVTASTMSLSIDRLESRGYVARERDRIDARKVQLRLTRHGVRLKESQSVLDPGVVRSMLKRLTPAKRDKALHGLALLAAAATEEMHQRGSATSWRRRSRTKSSSSPRTRGEGQHET